MKKILVAIFLSILFFYPGFLFAQAINELCAPCDPNNDTCGTYEVKDENGNVIETKNLVCVSSDGKTGKCETEGEITVCPILPPKGGDGTALGEIINRVIDFIFTLTVIIVPLMIVVAALMIMFAGENYELRERVKSIITWTLIGFAIVLFSKGIMAIVANILGIGD